MYENYDQELEKAKKLFPLLRKEKIEFFEHSITKIYLMGLLIYVSSTGTTS